jgi:hypothetical protein
LDGVEVCGREEGFEKKGASKSDQWVSHVRECSCPRAGSSKFEDGELDEIRDDGLREDSMASLRVSNGDAKAWIGYKKFEDLYNRVFVKYCH